MIDEELMHNRNSILFILISFFYLIQVMINIFIEGLASIFPPAFLFTVFGIILILLIRKSKPKDYNVCNDQLHIYIFLFPT